MRVARLHLMYQCMYYEYTEKEAAVTMKITHATMAEHTIYHSSKFQYLCWKKNTLKNCHIVGINKCFTPGNNINRSNLFEK